MAALAVDQTGHGCAGFFEQGVGERDAEVAEDLLNEGGVEQSD